VENPLHKKEGVGMGSFLCFAWG